MSKIGSFVLEQEERGDTQWNEEQRSYEFNHKIECRNGCAEHGRAVAKHTLGSNVFQRCLRYTSRRAGHSPKAGGGKKRIQALLAQAGRSTRTRILYRAALRRGRLSRSDLL